MRLDRETERSIRYWMAVTVVGVGLAGDIALESFSFGPVHLGLVVVLFFGLPGIRAWRGGSDDPE